MGLSVIKLDSIEYIYNLLNNEEDVLKKLMKDNMTASITNPIMNNEIKGCNDKVLFLIPIAINNLKTNNNFPITFTKIKDGLSLKEIIINNKENPSAELLLYFEEIINEKDLNKIDILSTGNLIKHFLSIDGIIKTLGDFSLIYTEEKLNNHHLKLKIKRF
jgi:hypothetical protein